MKRNIYVGLTVLLAHIHSAQAQVVQNNVVEHFTNTKCGVCASRNPGFYTSYKKQANTFHLAVHPSSPYSGCLLSQQNKADADSRTNYYGIFGSTPRLVINGTVISANSNYADTGIFTPYKNKTSPISMSITQTQFKTDSIVSRVVLKTVSTHAHSTVSLFMGLAEDTISYTGSNGEPSHYDVFRKSLTASAGNSVILPANIGDSLVLEFKSSVNNLWLLPRIFTIGILQETSSKKLIQAGKSNLTGTATGTLGTSKSTEAIEVTVYPNPANDRIQVIAGQNEPSELILLSTSGAVITSNKSVNGIHIIDISQIAIGQYILKVSNSKGIKTQSIIKL